MKTILQIVEELLAQHPIEVRAGFSRSDFNGWLEAAGYPNGEFEEIFCDFRTLSKRLVAEQALDIIMLKDVNSKKW